MMETTRRAGIVGIENSHAEEIVRYLNAPGGGLPVRVTALVAGEEARTRELARLGAVDTVVATADELLGSVDALIVTARDGADHRRLAVPFLEAGVPVWVDKPLAASVEDADAIVAAAERGGTVLTSSSALRWVDDTTRLVDRLGGLGALQTVTVSGPADPTSQYSGIFFYGIHAADVAQRIVPGRPGRVDVRATDGSVVARYEAGGVLVTLELIRPDDEGRVPFRATITGSHGVATGDIELGPDYVRPGVDAFLRMLDTGRPPVPYDQILAPIAVLDSIRSAL